MKVNTNDLFWFHDPDGRTKLVRVVKVVGNTVHAIAGDVYREQVTWTIGDRHVVEVSPYSAGSLLDSPAEIDDLLGLIRYTIDKTPPPPPEPYPIVTILEIFAAAPEWPKAKALLWKQLTTKERKAFKAQTRDCSFDVPPLISDARLIVSR